MMVTWKVTTKDRRTSEVRRAQEHADRARAGEENRQGSRAVNGATICMVVRRLVISAGQRDT